MRTLLTILLAVICAAGVAQKKPKINQAISAMQAGDLVEAKTIIDQAIVHEKTKDNPKTWFYRGQIYVTIDTTTNDPGAMDEALAAYNKTLELDPDQKSVETVDFTTNSIVNVDSKLNDYYVHYYLKGLDAFDVNDYPTAATNFETAFKIKADTNAILNAAYAASAEGDDERAKNNFRSSRDAGSKDRTIYIQLYSYEAKDENYEGALEEIQKGREVYPDDVELMKYEVNLLIQLEKSEEAKTKLENAIKLEPDNPDLYFSLGVLNDELGNEEEAVKGYKQAIDVDPSHYNSNFNMAVLLTNKANDLIRQRNDLNYKETAKIDALTKQIKEELTNALPLWEKVYSLDKQDPKALQTLEYIYSNLGMNDKAEKIGKEIDALQGN